MSRLAWREDGTADAPPLVLLNSIGSTGAMWDPALVPLAERFRVLRIEHPGHGGSPTRDPGSDRAIAELGADVIDVLDELELDRVSIAGVSLGAMIAMWLAAHRPERVGRIALICTSAALDPASWRERAASVRADGMAAVADAATRRWITPGLAERDPDLVTRIASMVRGVDAEGYAQCCTAIAAMDLRADLPRIAAPTLVVAGAQDPAIPPEHGRAIAAAIEDARFEVFDPAAHVPTFEQPARLAAMLIDHLSAMSSLDRGFRARRAVLGDDHVDRSVAATTPLTESFQHFLTRYAWGEVWSRTDELPARERSIATLAALVALGADNEIAMHVRGAKRNDLTDDEIAEVVMHVALYAGLPRANNAMRIVAEVLARR